MPFMRLTPHHARGCAVFVLYQINRTRHGVTIIYMFGGITFSTSWHTAASALDMFQDHGLNQILHQYTCTMQTHRPDLAALSMLWASYGDDIGDPWHLCCVPMPIEGLISKLYMFMQLTKCDGSGGVFVVLVDHLIACHSCPDLVSQACVDRETCSMFIVSFTHSQNLEADQELMVESTFCSSTQTGAS